MWGEVTHAPCGKIYDRNCAGRERENMLIVSQDRTWVANVENIVEITIEDRGVYVKDVNREMWERLPSQEGSGLKQFWVCGLFG